MSDPDLAGSRIMIVDDHEMNLRLLERIMRSAGYTNIATTDRSEEVEALYVAFRPELILLDLHMPGFNGFQVMEQLSTLVPAGTFCPILVLTADNSPPMKYRALAAGAKDFLTKPIDRMEVVLRVNNLLETAALHRQVREHNHFLEQKILQRTRDLEEAHTDALGRLARAAEFRDDATGQHVYRVGEVAARLARALGQPTGWIEMLRRTAPLHDVGKIGIPDEILLKPGKLTADEFARMQEHTTIGATLCAGSPSRLLQLAEEIALTHHERWDGAGYPQGLVGDEIPLSGQIVAVADVFDALTHARPYKQAWSVNQAITEIARQAGHQFAPRVVDAFMALVDAGDPAIWADAYISPETATA